MNFNAVSAIANAMATSPSRGNSHRWLTQLLRIMRLVAIFLFACALHVTAKTHSQTVTMKGKNLSLEKVLNEMSAQTGFDVVCDYQLLKNAKAVTVSVNNLPVTEFLVSVLAGQDLTFSIENTTVAIKKKAEGGVQLNLTPTFVEIPPITVQGRVVNEKGEPVVASITIKGTNKGVITDNSGNFLLENIADNAVLIISGINIQTQEFNINGRPEIQITVITKIQSEDEVVFKGYYTTTSRLNTGSVGKVSAAVIEKQPVSNVLQTMQGRVAGVYIQQVNGMPGSNFNIVVRGRNSIDKGSNPLYIIDGVPFTSDPVSSTQVSGQNIGYGGVNPLNGINQNDIESIEVLKDADATAIYGSRGANGVVLITTRKGRAGKTNVDLNIYSGISKVTTEMQLLNTAQYIEVRKEAYINDGLEIQPWDHDINGDWSAARYTNWQKELIGKSAEFTNAQLSVSGGSNNTQFRIGGGLQKQTTVFPGDMGYKKASIHFSSNHTSANQKFNGNFSISYVQDDNDLSVADLTGKALSLAPNAPELYGADGKLNWENSTWVNPLASLNQKYRAKTNTLVANAVLSYKLIENVEVKVNAGFNDIRIKESATTPASYYDPAYNVTAEYSTAFLNNGMDQSWIIEPQLSWKKNIGNGVISMLAGASLQERSKEQLTQYGEGFPSDALLEDMDAAFRVVVAENNILTYKYAAGFGRINYTWKDKLSINITGRRDGSSRFGPGKRFANFGAVGSAWIFSNERFINTSLPFLSFGKLRASYGTSGNDQIGNYEYLDNYESTTGYNGTTGLAPIRLYNPDFAWEVNKKIEAAVELGFVRNRLNFVFAYYRNRSSNQLVNYPLSRVTGFSGIQSNLSAIVQNTGLEMEARANILTGSAFQWSANLNFTIPKNKLVAFPLLDKSTYANSYILGQPLNILRRYKYIGVDAQDGLYKVEDVNHDNTYNLEDTYPVFTGQKYYGGFNNSLVVKGITLDIFLQFVKQNGFAFRYYNAMPGNGNQPVEVLNRWKQSGDVASFQRFATYNNADAVQAFDLYNASDGVIVDKSFIRLKNISLSYQLPDKLVKGKIRCYIMAQNLVTFTGYQGMDPETNGAFQLPPLKTITAGVQLSF